VRSDKEAYNQLAASPVSVLSGEVIMFRDGVQCVVSYITVIAMTVLIGACKIRVLVPEGGHVVSSSGSFNCPALGDCEIDVLDIYFDETFRANPESGWRFSYWSPVFRGFCGGKKGSCHLSTRGFHSNPGLISMLESDAVFYLVPVFEPLSRESCFAP
jgi:hypothetical protein